jgi:plastocyanin
MTIFGTTVLLLTLLMSSQAEASTLEGTVTAKGMADNADAVVYIDGIPGKSFPAPKEPVTMDQRNMVFLPRVLPVLIGTTVEFLNSDNVAHNVFSPDKCADEFDLGNWTRGEARSREFNEPCAATILCFVHPGMEAFVVAVPTPYFAKTDQEGRFSIEDLPDGSYTVKVWHPTLKTLTQQVEVKGTTSTDLVLEK